MVDLLESVTDFNGVDDDRKPRSPFLLDVTGHLGSLRNLVDICYDETTAADEHFGDFSYTQMSQPLSQTSGGLKFPATQESNPSLRRKTPEGDAYA